MEKELGEGNKKPEILSKLAQYELTLLDWVEGHKGSRKYVAIAGKMLACIPDTVWFVPCYVNSRLTDRGIRFPNEVDIYGALSEFIGTVVSQDTVTLLDIIIQYLQIFMKRILKANLIIHRKIRSWASTAETLQPASCPSAQ